MSLTHSLCAAVRRLRGLYPRDRVASPAHGATRLLSAVPSGRFRTLATVPDLAGAPGSWVQVMMAGAFTDPRYGDFVIDDAYMDHLVKNFTDLDLAVAIDKDHSPYTTGSTEAMGWVKQLQRRSDSTLWAYVLWTAEGVTLVESAAYRYFSPEFTDDYEDKYGKTHGPTLLGGGLTNRPFLTGMQEVSLALHADQALATLQTDVLVLSAGHALFLSAPPTPPNKETRTVDREQLISLYGLPSDATDDQIMAAATAARAAQLAAAGAQPAAGSGGAAGDGAASEPSEREVAALARAKTAMDALRDREVEDAVKAGTLAPALRDHIVKTWDREVEATGDAAETRAMLAAMPKILRTGSTGSGAGAGGASGADDLPADAPRSTRLHAKAMELQRARPGLAYRDAVMEADQLIEQDKPHVLAAIRDRAAAL